VRLHDIRIAGFGRLADRTIAFAPGLTVIVGRNEAGKSTLATAIAAALYGVGRRRDAWRPWSGAPYAATLRYELDDGRTYEVQRNFEEPKAVRVYDRNGTDVAGEVAIAKIPAPGETHLGVPYDVFVNASCVRQQEIGVDDERGSAIASALSRALDGGPKDNAAVQAIAALDRALRDHVGTARATKNAPLKQARERAAEARANGAAARADLHALADLRAEVENATSARDALAAGVANAERRVMVARAAALRSRLAALQALRDEIAELQAARSAFEDVDAWPNDLAERLERADRDCERTRALAVQATEAAAGARLAAADETERLALRKGVGTVDDAAFAALVEAATHAREAAAQSAEAGTAAAHARQTGEGGAAAFGALVAVAAVAALLTVGFGVAADWLIAVLCAVAAIAAGFAVYRIAARRTARRKRADAAQARADAASAAERAAASTIAGILEPLGIATVEELGRRRERLRTLEERATHAAELAAVAESAAGEAARADAAFAAAAAAARAPSGASRDEVRALVRRNDARKRERDGLGARLDMLLFQRRTELGTDDEESLEHESERLARIVGEAPAEPGVSLRSLHDERAELEQRLHAAEQRCAAAAATLRASESHVADIAALDDRTVEAEAEVARLEAFQRAIELAKATVERRTKESHEVFARRLEDYAASTFATITGGRYTEIAVDPTTLEVRVRAPETREIVTLDRLSAGTRDQAYLVVRLAMVRMFSEGLETPPFLLDDPVAFWDEARIARLLPLLVDAASRMQTVIFTASEALAVAAKAHGASVIALHADRALPA
jgi:DNA repair exonuclease SbcCD ATPase subunit